MPGGRQVTNDEGQRVFVLGNRMPCCGRSAKRLLPAEVGEVFDRTCHGLKGAKGKSGLHETERWTVRLEEAHVKAPGVVYLKAVFERKG